MEKCQKLLNKVFVFLYFFLVPVDYSSYVLLGFVFLSSAFFLCRLLTHETTGLSSKETVLLLMMLIITVFGVMLSPHPVKNTAQTLFFLFVVLSSCRSDNDSIDRSSLGGVDWFYWCVLASTLAHLVLFVQSNPGARNFYISGGAWDVNVWVMVFFSFVIYCDAHHYKLWVLVAALVFFFCSESRGCLLVFASFVLIKVLKLVIKKTRKNKHWASRLRNLELNSLCVLTFVTVSVIVFSYFWTFVVSSSDVSYYHQSINDGSNAVRFRSNVYVIERLLNYPDFFFFGYDNSIRSVLGDFGTENNALFLGYRLVQSHNSVINLFMKNGVVFSVFYILAISSLFRHSFDYKRLEHWLPYLVGSMILHSLFSTGYLLLFSLALCSEKETGKRSIVRSGGAPYV